MKEVDVDNIYEYVKNEDIAKLANYITDDELKNEFLKEYFADNSDILDELANDAIKNILDEIKKSNLFEYFENKGFSDEENIDVFTTLIVYDTISVEKADKYIERLSNVDNCSYYIKEIAAATHSTEFIKKCINDKREQLSNINICHLIKATKDNNYIKDVVENNPFDLNELSIIYLIKATKDLEYIDKFVKDKDMDIPKYLKLDLIASTSNIDFIEKYINDENLGFNSDDKSHLIIATHNIEFIDNCIRNPKYDFSKYEIANMIVSTRDLEYVKKCLHDDSLELGNEYIVWLIQNFPDKEFKKECIENENLGLSIQEKVQLVTWINDPDYINQYFHDNIDELSSESKVKLIDVMNIEDIKKYIIEFKDEFSQDQKMSLIARVGDFDFLKECAKNEIVEIKPIDLFGFEPLNDNLKKEIKQYIDEEYNSNKNAKIELPKGMTIGVEIEAEGKSVYESLLDGWKSKRDGSLHEGTEVVSPILTGSSEDVDNIFFYCNVLKASGLKSSQRCGGHIHIGADYLTDKESYQNLLEIWSDCEKILYVISNDEGEITRYGGASHYCAPISQKLERSLQSGSINIESEEGLQQFIEQIKTSQVDRYSGINFMNLQNDKNTVEFRLANGTINPETWINNINLFGGIIAAAEKIYQIQSQEQSELTDEEIKYIEYFSKIKSKESTDEEKLDSLLGLAVSKESKEIYVNRYKANIYLLEKDEEENRKVKNVIEGTTIVKPLEISKIKEKVKDVDVISKEEAQNHIEQDRRREILRGEQEWNQI